MSDTRQRVAVREELARDVAFRSAQDVHARLRASGTRIGLTTVYRALQAMAESGEVDVMRRSCGTTVEVDGPAVERWAEKVAAEHGFSSVEHTVEVFGTCTRCS